MGSKTYDHNGKEIKKSNGKNIRVPTETWEKVRRFCIKRGWVMGTFVQKAITEQMKRDLFKTNAPQ